MLLFRCRSRCYDGYQPGDNTASSAWLPHVFHDIDLNHAAVGSDYYEHARCMARDVSINVSVVCVKLVLRCQDRFWEV